MASSRERLELANVPPTYRGLPIAFVLQGSLALAFMGFPEWRFLKLTEMN
jgi:electron transport complex protein RnfA